MIVIAFMLFAALVIAWLSAPGKLSVPQPTPAPVMWTSEATA